MSSPINDLLYNDEKIIGSVEYAPSDYYETTIEWDLVPDRDEEYYWDEEYYHDDTLHDEWAWDLEVGR